MCTSILFLNIYNAHIVLDESISGLTFPFLSFHVLSVPLLKVRDVFWSQAQTQARENLGVRQVLAALNRLWRPDAHTPVDLTKSLR